MKKKMTQKQRDEWAKGFVKTLDNCQQILSNGYEKRKKILQEISSSKKKKK